MPGQVAGFEIDIDEKIARVRIGRAIPYRRDPFVLDDEVANVRKHPGNLRPASYFRIRRVRDGRERR